MGPRIRLGLTHRTQKGLLQKKPERKKPARNFPKHCSTPIWENPQFRGTNHKGGEKNAQHTWGKRARYSPRTFQRKLGKLVKGVSGLTLAKTQRMPPFEPKMVLTQKASPWKPKFPVGQEPKMGVPKILSFRRGNRGRGENCPISGPFLVGPRS